MGKRNSDFLLGESVWFGARGLQNHLEHEVDCPDEWGEMGWRRQRLQPLLTKFLYPSAWSAFMLAAGGIPLFLESIGYGIGMQTIHGLGLWLGAFILILLSAFSISMHQVEGSPLQMLSWNLVRIETVLLGVLTWAIHSNPSGFQTTVALLISLPLWLSFVVRISTVLAWPAGRWLLPIAHVDIGLSELEDSWVAESRRWARRPLARRKISANQSGTVAFEMVLFGIRQENLDYLAIHLVHPSGAILDPFVGPSIGDTVPFKKLGPMFSDVPYVVSVREFFGSPPVSPVVATWPSSLDSLVTEEE